MIVIKFLRVNIIFHDPFCMWHDDGSRFTTTQEAYDYIHSLPLRWSLIREVQIIEADQIEQHTEKTA